MQRGCHEGLSRQVGATGRYRNAKLEASRWPQIGLHAGQMMGLKGD